MSLCEALIQAKFATGRGAPGLCWLSTTPCASLGQMSVTQTPMASERVSQDAEASYDLWFRTKVAEALHSTQPPLPPDAPVARV